MSQADESGWFPMPRFPRGAHNNPFHGDALTRALFQLLCEEARYKDAFRMLRNQQVTLKAGELCTSQDDLAESLGAGRQSVRRCLDKLTRLGLIVVTSNAMGTIISVPHLMDHYARWSKRKHVDNANSNQAESSVGNQAHESANADAPTASEDEHLVGNQEEGLWTNQAPTKRQPDKEKGGTKGEKALTPHSPPASGGAPVGRPISIRAFKPAARVIVGDLERAIMEAETEDEARAIIGDGWEPLIAQFGTWQKLASATTNHFKTYGRKEASRYFVDQVAARLAVGGHGGAREASFDLNQGHESPN